MVTRVIRRGAYKLKDVKDKWFPNSWNAQHLTSYYINSELCFISNENLFPALPPN